MSWMQRLYETYNNCADIVGLQTPDKSGVLLPVAHTLLRAHITVRLDAQGNFLSAEVLEDTQGTISPCTEDSESRSSNPSPHPLFDKLQYLAGDFLNFTGTDNRVFYDLYIKNLQAWCNSAHGHPKVTAILHYLERGCLIHDLVASKVFHAGSDGLLLDKWNGSAEDIPAIFTIKNCVPSTALVRFAVSISGDTESRVWMDRSVRASHIAYVRDSQTKKQLCYATGHTLSSIEKHPKKIVNTLANAKLISANDDVGFTYRGRFERADQAVGIGFETSFMVHNALRWLVDTRALRAGSQVVVTWGTKNENVPSPLTDAEDAFDQDAVIEADLLTDADVRTLGAYARGINRSVLGLHYPEISHLSRVTVLALASSTAGRLAITYYRELLGDEYLDCVAHWHKTCTWRHQKKTRSGESITYIGAPAVYDIAKAAYGPRIDEQLMNNTVKRILSCVLDGTPIPRDLVWDTVRRASNPIALEGWEWSRTLSVACALYKKQYEKEEYTLALDENRTDRAYLFGRLLAVADWLEGWALRDAGESRETNAMRLMNAFSQRPLKTWGVLAKALRPYQARLGLKAQAYNNTITEIMSKFSSNDFNPVDDRPLDGLYLLGYHCQRQAFIDRIAERKAAGRPNTEDTSNNTDIL